MKNICFLIIGFFLFFSCSSLKKGNKGKGKKNNVNYMAYYPVIYEADSLFYSKEYDKSFKKLDSLFKKFKMINVLEEQQLYIETAYLSNQKIDFKKCFKVLIENNSFNKRHYKKKFISILDKYVTSNEYVKWKNNFNKKIIPGLEKMLVEMNISDQKYRTEKYSSYEFQYKRDSIDEINEKKLIKIFNLYGYPNSTNHNRSYKTTVGTILLHTNDSIRVNFFAPKVLEFIKNGECSPITYASLIDQYHLYNGERQIYNSYLNEAVKYDTIKTKTLRLKIGLPKSLSLNHWIAYNELIITMDSIQLKNNSHLLKVYEKNIYK